DSVVSEDVWPAGCLRRGWGGDDAESVGMLDDGDGLHLGRSDVPALSAEADLRGLLDGSRMVDREVQVKERRIGCRTPACGAAGDAGVHRLVRRHAGGAAHMVGVVPGDLGGEKFVGLLTVA